MWHEREVETSAVTGDENNQPVPATQSSNPDAGSLDWWVKLAPVIQRLFPLDCMISVTDKEKFVCHIPGREISLGDVVGKTVPQGSIIFEAINTGKFVHRLVSKETYGIPFKATSVPVMDDKGNVVGGVGLGISLVTQETLIGVAQTVASSSQQVSATVEELASSAEQLAKQQQELQALGTAALEQLKSTEKILAFINEVAANSNLLGLNAAIEAARAGEHGRGFSVVAEEIRKMAVNSAASVKEVKGIISTINRKLELMVEKINETVAIGQQQAAATQEISATVQEMASSAEKLEKVAEII